MPKKIDPALRERAVRLVREHRAEYSSITAAAVAVAVARQLGVARESVRRWVALAEIDAGGRPGTTSEESAEIKRLKAENRRLREDNEILKAATVFFAGGTRPPQPLVLAFIAEQAAAGRAVESICRVLREQGCQVAARTYREWKRPSRPVAARTLTDAQALDAVRDAAWTTGPDGVRRLAPEGLYGRRKMTAHLRRTGIPGASAGAVDRAMRALGLTGVRRGKATRTTVPGRDGCPARDLLDRNFTAPAPNRVWVSDFSYVRSWAGFAYVVFIVDVYAQNIVAWHAATTRTTELVMTPLRMAIWQRSREDRPSCPVS